MNRFDIDAWHQLRVIRNRFAHDYPDDDALKAAHLNQAAQAVPLLAALLQRFAPLALSASPAT